MMKNHMTTAINRIVSFLPSATELLYELESENCLYGVTHECKYPQDAMLKPQVISSVIDSEKLTSKEIDTTTCTLLNEGKDIFVLNKENLLDANPDLIISQETCEVCAAYTNQVNDALQILQNKKPIVHSMNPHSLQGILDSVITLGKLLEKEEKALEITSKLKKRIDYIKENQKEQTKPKVLAIEWIEPFFTAGHWVPEMIEIAGGQNQISVAEEHSRKMKLEEIIDANPDIIIIMSCGFDTKRIVSEYDKILREDKNWNLLDAVKNNKVFAVDANSYFSKPSIRTIEGLEILAKIIQPSNFQEITVSENSFLQIP